MSRSNEAENQSEYPTDDPVSDGIFVGTVVTLAGGGVAHYFGVSFWIGAVVATIVLWVVAAGGATHEL